MTFQDMVSEIGQLTLQERLLLLEALTQSLKEELSPPVSPPLEHGQRVPQTKGSSLMRVRGMAKPDGPPPTDEEVQNWIADYLIEKHR